MPDGIKNTQTKNTCRFFLVFGHSIFSSRRSLIQHVRLISYVSDLLLNALNPEIDFLFFRSLFTAKFNFCSEVFFLRFFTSKRKVAAAKQLKSPGGFELNSSSQLDLSPRCSSDWWMSKILNNDVFFHLIPFPVPSLLCKPHVYARAEVIQILYPHCPSCSTSRSPRGRTQGKGLRNS